MIRLLQSIPFTTQIYEELERVVLKDLMELVAGPEE